MKSLLTMLGLVAIVGFGSAQPFYTGAYGEYPHCQACHDNQTPPTNQYDAWNRTSHAGAYDDHPELQWAEDCLPCHTTGWDVNLANHGFDDYFFINDTLGMQQMRNVQCESCHGPTDQIPHPTTTVIDFHAEVCGTCHHDSLGNRTYEEWSSCQHGQTADSSAHQLACAKCHEAAGAADFLKTGSAPVSLPDDPLWQITCASCHTTHLRESFGVQLYQPEDQICRICHSLEEAVPGGTPHAPQREMLLGTANPDTLQLQQWQWPGYSYSTSCHECLPGCPTPPCIYCHLFATPIGNPPGASGHAMQPQIETCAAPSCHANAIPPDSSFNINHAITETDSLVAVLAAALLLADTTTQEYARAKFDYEFVVQDGSHGVHNFFYARDLLESSIAGLAAMGIGTGPSREGLPGKLTVMTAYPNPFNPVAIIRFVLPQAEQVSLEIFNVKGGVIEIHDLKSLPFGAHQITVDGSDWPSGIYIYRLRAGEWTASGKLVLLK